MPSSSLLHQGPLVVCSLHQATLLWMEISGIVCDSLNCTWPEVGETCPLLLQRVVFKGRLWIDCLPQLPSILQHIKESVSRIASESLSWTVTSQHSLPKELWRYWATPRKKGCWTEGPSTVLGEAGGFQQPSSEPDLTWGFVVSTIMPKWLKCTPSGWDMHICVLEGGIKAMLIKKQK